MGGVPGPWFSGEMILSWRYLDESSQRQADILSHDEGLFLEMGLVSQYKISFYYSSYY